MTRATRRNSALDEWNYPQSENDSSSEDTKLQRVIGCMCLLPLGKVRRQAFRQRLDTLCHVQGRQEQRLDLRLSECQLPSRVIQDATTVQIIRPDGVAEQALQVAVV